MCVKASDAQVFWIIHSHLSLSVNLMRTVVLMCWWIRACHQVTWGETLFWGLLSELKQPARQAGTHTLTFLLRVYPDYSKIYRLKTRNEVVRTVWKSPVEPGPLDHIRTRSAQNSQLIQSLLLTLGSFMQTLACSVSSSYFPSVAPSRLLSPPMCSGDGVPLVCQTRMEVIWGWAITKWVLEGCVHVVGRGAEACRHIADPVEWGEINDPSEAETQRLNNKTG